MKEYLESLPHLIEQLPYPVLILHFAIAFISIPIMQYFVIPFTIKQISYRHHTWSQAITQFRSLNAATYLLPLLLIDDGLSTLKSYSEIVKYLEIAITIVCTFFAVASIKTAAAIYQLYPISKRHPISTYVELMTLLSYILGTLIIFSLLLDKSPIYLLSGLGALTAVLMLVFKDTIQSFVAGIQISVNNLIQENDWIEVASLGVNGNVERIKLHFIQVRNFDNTTMTIPTHKVVEGSFKNWRSVFNLNARRIVTSLNLDHDSIAMLNQSKLKKITQCKELTLLTDIVQHNEQYTNLTLFRLYTEAYVKSLPQLSKKSTLLVRLLDSTPQGIPLQIYCFSEITGWVEFEAIKSSILEHLLAVMPLFELKTFQLHYSEA